MNRFLFMPLVRENKKTNRDLRKLNELLKTKPTTHLEIGHGIEPHALMKAALKKRGTKRKRLFLGIDLNEVSQKEMNRIHKQRKTPNNLKIIKANAIKALKQTPTESITSIKATYVTNNMAFQATIEQNRVITEEEAFFREASRALKKGGMIFLTSDYADIDSNKKFAKANGLVIISIKPLTEKECEQSIEPEIRSRAQEHNKKRILEYNYGTNYEKDKDLQKLIKRKLKQLKLKKDTDLITPTVYIFRKK